MIATGTGCHCFCLKMCNVFQVQLRKAAAVTVSHSGAKAWDTRTLRFYYRLLDVTKVEVFMKSLDFARSCRDFIFIKSLRLTRKNCF